MITGSEDMEATALRNRGWSTRPPGYAAGSDDRGCAGVEAKGDCQPRRPD